MPTYELYKKNACPFCQKVMTFMKKNAIQGFEMKDIVEDPKNKEDLITRGGKNQVPCLFIDGKALYESEDIIQYMREHLIADASNDDGNDAAPGVCNVL